MIRYINDMKKKEKMKQDLTLFEKKEGTPEELKKI